MLTLIQRVRSAKVEVTDRTVGEISHGLLVFLGIEKNDTPNDADRLLKKVLAYRVFSDEQGKMNKSVTDTQGGLLIVSQFTLAADTDRGLRPGFSSAKAPEEAETLYEYFLSQARLLHSGKVANGLFGGNMQVSLVNDGPVTFLLR